MNIQINDCTIRDGGYLLEKNSPQVFVHKIVEGLTTAGIDIIEIGFLQTVTKNETIVYNNSVGARKYIPSTIGGARFTGFCDNSRYSLDNLDDFDGKSFEYLRISFAKHECKEALTFVAGAKKKGYKVFANPMDAPSFTPQERSEIISAVNDFKPYCFSIVDTFGTMYISDLRSIFDQVNRELDPSIKIGLHSHNNLQLSNALAEAFIDLAVDANRSIAVDASLYGMGRGAGNASTEIIASYLNTKYGKKYDLGILFDTIEKQIISLPSSATWGYDLPMFICGSKSSHVDNITYLQNKYHCGAREIYQIISSMHISNRKRYGSSYSKTDFSELEKAYTKFLDDRR
jgi:hypothetical protein